MSDRADAVSRDAERPAAEAALPERDRNRLLRRADWRYLLPDAAPARALCLARGALRASCELVAGRTDDAPVAGIAYDLVVAEDPDEAALAAIAAVLAPTGACYTEWTRRRPGAPVRVRAALARAGLRAPRLYHPWPSMIDCRAWVPVDGAAATYFWRGPVRTTRVRRERLRAIVDGVLARLGVHARLAAVAVGPIARAEPQLLRVTHGTQDAATTTADGERHDAPLLVTRGERSVGKIVALEMGGDGRPARAVKTARTADGAAGLLREAALLHAVRALHPLGMSGVPSLLARAELLGRPVVAETAFDGVPIAALLTHRRYPRIVERVTDWLCDFATPASRADAEPVWERIVAPALERFTAEFGPVLDDERLRRARELLGGLGALPVVCEQRDFSPWNVFDDEGNLVVLDWESGEPRGLPALDLIYFATHAAYYLERAWVTGRFREAHHTAWSRDSELGRVNHASVAHYLDRLGLGAELLLPLRLCAWVVHAHSDYVHLAADAGRAPDVNALRTSRFLQLYDAELDSAADD